METTILLMMIEAVIFLAFLISVSALIFMMADKPPRFYKMAEHRRQKELLRHNLYRYRLASMLRHLGIPLENYVMELPEGEIRKHITRCKNCPNIPECDRFLSDGDGKAPTDIQFCPNYGSLFAYSKRPALNATAKHRV
jgi:hypothetical protein